MFSIDNLHTSFNDWDFECIFMLRDIDEEVEQTVKKDIDRLLNIDLFLELSHFINYKNV